MNDSTLPRRLIDFIHSSGMAPENCRAVWADVNVDLARDLDDMDRELARFVGLRGTSTDNQQIESRQENQRDHWRAVFSDPLVDDFAARAMAIGKAHANMDMPLTWHLASFAWILVRFIPRLTAKHASSKADLDQALQTMLIRSFIDMILSNAAYGDVATKEHSDDQAYEADITNLKILAKTVGDVNEVALDLAFLSKHTRDVSGSAQTISSAAAELVSSIEEISRNSEAASADADATDATVSSGRKAVEKVNEAIRNIAAAVDETSTSVDELSRASEQIGQILAVIENIARQTNLLALNATIEAARAGAAGRGFAVVASEVKGLSTQTSKSTDDIARRISSLRQGMNVILTTMERSKMAVADGQSAISDAAGTMVRVADQVAHVSGRMNGVADILHQQKGATAEIAQSIGRVAQTAVENEQRLNVMAGKLHDSNDRFSANAKNWFKADSHRALCEMANTSLQNG